MKVCVRVIVESGSGSGKSQVCGHDDSHDKVEIQARVKIKLSADVGLASIVGSG